MTDGKSHQTVTGVINDLITEIGGPLIAAGIGGDTNATYLETLATNPSTVVYEQNRNKSLQLGIRIIEAMRDTAALCADEGIINNSSMFVLVHQHWLNKNDNMITRLRAWL